MLIVIVAFVVTLGLLFHMIMSESVKTENIHRHLTAEDSYAHYSAINSNNYMITPSLLMCRPQKFTLTAGESLWIPRGWWHWVRTSGPSVAVNFWIPVRIGSSIVPYKLTDFNQPPDLLTAIESASKECSVWNSNLDIIVKNQQKLHDNEYIITLKGYDRKGKPRLLNQRLLATAKEHAIIPDGAGMNVWVSNGKHDTGLHYDDNDGILSVLRGTKHITLYSPNDTPYLRPLSILPRWATQPAAKISYNLYKFERFLPKTSLPSARILYESITSKPVLCEITKMKNETSKPLVWGCKLEKGVMRWEIYVYHYDIYDNTRTDHVSENFRLPSPQSCLIHSIDLFDRPEPLGTDIHYYYINSSKFPIHGYGTTGLTLRESDFRIDDSFRMRERFHRHAKDIGFSDEDSVRCMPLVYQYECKHIAIWNKYKNQLYIQYYGISVGDFIHFLKQHGYPAALIKHVSTGGYEEIEHEITIVYDLQTLQPVRSGFYGIV